MTRIYFLFLFCVSVASSLGPHCGRNQPTLVAAEDSSGAVPNVGLEADAVVAEGFPYDLSSPSVAFPLPSRLNEISGLSFVSDSVLVTIEDERGRIYWIDARTGEVLDERRFGGDGDYEGIEIVNGVVYVLRSDGRLFEIPLDRKRLRAKRHSTGLSGSDDTEGLAYDINTNSLLVTPKESKSEAVTVYRIDLDSDELLARPLLSIPHEMINSTISAISSRQLDFRPSGIAVQNATGDLYILSSTASALLVVGNDGKLKHVVSLVDERLRQPEGIAFDANGTLYISSEARGRDPWILAYPQLDPPESH